MDKKLNPLDWEIDLLWDTVSDIVRKLNPLTWRLELIYSADSYIQKINPFIWDFDMVWGSSASYIIKEVTWSWYINLTNAMANWLLGLKAYGWIEQSWTPTPTTPVDIVCNNGAIKFSKNMSNVNEQTVLVWYYISTQWVVTADANNRTYQDFIPCKPSTKYTLSFSSEVYYVTISEYVSADDSGFYRRNAGSSGGNVKLTITTGANTTFLRFGANMFRNVAVTLEDVLAVNWQLEIWDTPTAYHPYKEMYIDWTTETIEDWLGNIATTENLLAIWDVKDEQNVLNWHITKNIGIMILDGTENWQLATSTDLVQFYTSSTQGVIANNVSLYSTIAPYGCTVATRAQYDFGCYSWNSWNLCFQMKGSATLTTLSAWAQFLTDQYAAWTPVIVAYPRVTASTQLVVGQHLNIPAWNSTIEITQASIDNLWLYAKYKATA